MKKLRNVSMIVLFAFVFMAAVPASAQSIKKFAYIDLSRLFDNYDKTKEYDQKMQKESEGYESERNAKIDKLKEVQGKLALLKEDEKDKVQKEFEELRADLLAFDQAQRADLGKQRDEKIREILLEIEKIVSDYAKKNDYDMIVNDRVLIYGDPKLDISESILEILNKEYNTAK